jgi:hypothetical protein
LEAYEILKYLEDNDTLDGRYASGGYVHPQSLFSSIFCVHNKYYIWDTRVTLSGDLQEVLFVPNLKVQVTGLNQNPCFLAIKGQKRYWLMRSDAQRQQAMEYIQEKPKSLKKVLYTRGEFRLVSA